MSDFIYENFIDTDICDKLIEEYETNDSKYPGMIGNGSAEDNVNNSVKKSTEIILKDINNTKLVQNYFDKLKNIMNEYVKIYPYSSDLQKGFSCSGFKIQKYLPNEGFFKWHFEEDGGGDDQRHLVFMTYLNDVDNGGTEFLYQDKKIEAKKGKTLIWPAGWTHTHRGVISKKDVKYIVTGWYSYTHTIDKYMRNSLKY